MPRLRPIARTLLNILIGISVGVAALAVCWALANASSGADTSPQQGEPPRIASPTAAFPR